MSWRSWVRIPSQYFCIFLLEIELIFVKCQVDVIVNLTKYNAGCLMCVRKSVLIFKPRTYGTLISKRLLPCRISNQRFHVCRNLAIICTQMRLCNDFASRSFLLTCTKFGFFISTRESTSIYFYIRAHCLEKHHGSLCLLDIPFHYISPWSHDVISIQYFQKWSVQI